MNITNELLKVTEHFDFRTTEAFQSAMTQVKGIVEQMPSKFTIGELSRAAPDHRKFLLDILESLRDNKIVDYVDYKPMPTIVQKI